MWRGAAAALGGARRGRGGGRPAAPPPGPGAVWGPRDRVERAPVASDAGHGAVVGQTEVPVAGVREQLVGLRGVDAVAEVQPRRLVPPLPRVVHLHPAGVALY